MNIRKSVKKIAFEEPKSVHIKALAVYVLILSFVSYFSMNFMREESLIILFSFIVTLPLYLNFNKICLDGSRDELISFGDLFSINKYSFKFSLYFALIVLVFYLLTIVLNLMGVIGLIISLILTLYMFPIFMMMPFIFLDNVDLSLKDFIFKTIELIRKKRIAFYGLVCSFGIWYLIGLLTLGILYLWIIPYVFISMAYFYLSLNKEKSFKKEKSLSDMVIIVLFLVVIVGINVVSFMVYPNSFTDFTKSVGIK